MRVSDSNPLAISSHTADQAAVILKVSANWMRDKARAGVIPCTMVGGSYHFTDEHLRETLRLFERPAAPVPVLVPRVPARRRDAGLPEVPVLQARTPRRRNAA